MVCYFVGLIQKSSLKRSSSRKSPAQFSLILAMSSSVKSSRVSSYLPSTLQVVRLHVHDGFHIVGQVFSADHRVNAGAMVVIPGLPFKMLLKSAGMIGFIHPDKQMHGVQQLPFALQDEVKGENIPRLMHQA